MIVVVGVRRGSFARNRAITSRTHGLSDIKHVKKMNEKIDTCQWAPPSAIRLFRLLKSRGDGGMLLL